MRIRDGAAVLLLSLTSATFLLAQAIPAQTAPAHTWSAFMSHGSMFSMQRLRSRLNAVRFSVCRLPDGTDAYSA